MEREHRYYFLISELRIIDFRRNFIDLLINIYRNIIMKRITNETPCTHLQNENSIFIGDAIKSCVSCCGVILQCMLQRMYKRVNGTNYSDRRLK